MSGHVVVQITGDVDRMIMPVEATRFEINGCRVAAVSESISYLTNVTKVYLSDNALTEIPAGIFRMPQLKSLGVYRNRITAIPPEIGRLTALKTLLIGHNRLTELPRELGQLILLKGLNASNNELTSVPPELGQLLTLDYLNLSNNRLTWLPLSLGRLRRTELFFAGNALPIDVSDESLALHSRHRLPELFAATTSLSMIREEATTLAIALQDLELPALLTLEIIDAAFPNSIPMHKKWDLAVAVKHFHTRRHAVVVRRRVRRRRVG